MGGQKGIVHFYEDLVSHHEVIMLASQDNIEEINTSFPVQTILFPNKQMTRNRLLLKKLREIVEKEYIDCIIAEHSYTGWMAYALRRSTGIPFIIHSHNLEVYRFKQMKKKGWWIYKPYEKWIHQKANHNFFISKDDMITAIRDFKLDASKCSVAPYGIQIPGKIENAKQKFYEKYGIENRYIFHFNGTMDYEPNVDAVNYLVNYVDPILAKLNFDYKIVITGKRLDEAIQQNIKRSNGIVYLDFIEDINLLYQASDLFLNPVVNNSGIKTKVIEALANHCTVISSRSGANGIPEEIAKEKLKQLEDHDWKGFCDAIVKEKDIRKETPPAFFEYFSWQNIAAKAAEKINEVVSNAGRKF